MSANVSFKDTDIKLLFQIVLFPNFWVFCTVCNFHGSTDFFKYFKMYIWLDVTNLFNIILLCRDLLASLILNLNSPLHAVVILQLIAIEIWVKDFLIYPSLY